MLRQVALLTLAAICVLTIGSVHSADEDTSRPVHTIWLRNVFQHDNSGNETPELNLAAEGALTVYLNGQRLVKNSDSPDKTLLLDVKPLIRTGRNSIAVQLTSPTAEIKLSVWLSSADRKSQTISTWKGTKEAPPVGWQQTDFNDRDWKPAAVAEVPNADSAGKIPLTWQSASTASRFAEGRFSFRDGDHVLLIGGTFIERAQQYGHLEAALNRDPKIDVTFRNLGWSADTVFADSRGIFDSPEKGYERLVEHVRAEEPTVILLCYGQNEAMSTDDPQRFRSGLKKLHADLATTGAEIVFISPHPFVKVKPPLPNPERWNPSLAEFSAATKQLAAELKSPYVDLFPAFLLDMAKNFAKLGEPVMLPIPVTPDPREFDEYIPFWTDNGMHWNDGGYRAVATVVMDRLSKKQTASPSLSVRPEKNSLTAVGCEIRNVLWNANDNTLLTAEFRKPNVTPYPAKIIFPDDSSGIRVTVGPAEGKGLSEAVAMALVDGDNGSHLEFQTTINPDYDRLQQLTVRKNELYFHRWRPQNITYLFGFRKHEQGNNASEIAMFDPLIDKLEEQIQSAKQPTWQKIIVKKAPLRR